MLKRTRDSRTDRLLTKRAKKYIVRREEYVVDYMQRLIERYPQLSGIQGDIEQAYRLLAASFESGGKLLVAGNGGSAADADHIAGELMKGFVKKRRVTGGFAAKLRSVDAESGAYLAAKLQQGLPAVSLAAHTAFVTATLNDNGGDLIYAQGVCALGTSSDAFMGISTSGNSANVVYAVLTAKAKGLKTVALTGGSGGKIARLADCALVVPETETYLVQELHLPVYHALCLMLEERFFA